MFGHVRTQQNYLHVRSGKQLKFSSPTAFMAEKKSIIDFAYPGDIVGLHDTGNFKIGDTFTEGEKLKFTGIPSFAPEQFRYIENADPLKFKQLPKASISSWTKAWRSSSPRRSTAARSSAR